MAWLQLHLQWNVEVSFLSQATSYKTPSVSLGSCLSVNCSGKVLGNITELDESSKEALGTEF